MLYKTSEQWWALIATIVFGVFFAFTCIAFFSMFPLWVWIALGFFCIVAICLIDIPGKNRNWRFRSSIGGIMLALIALIISCAAKDWMA